ncbi:MAG TPA: hypothetical protein VGI28_09260 [Stellaceae bacterium]
MLRRFSKATGQVWPRGLLAATVQDTNGRLEGGWRHTAAFEFGGEIDREDDLCQLALAVGPRPAVAAGPHHIGEVNWIISQQPSALPVHAAKIGA